MFPTLRLNDGFKVSLRELPGSNRLCSIIRVHERTFLLDLRFPSWRMVRDVGCSGLT